MKPDQCSKFPNEQDSSAGAALRKLSGYMTEGRMFAKTKADVFCFFLISNRSHAIIYAAKLKTDTSENN